jgi:organic hydroperoxide reductase OsmC/OhrA
MASRPRVFEFAVDLDPSWDVIGDRGGSPLHGAEREEWTPEHLVLAGLTRCVLTSLAFHARRAGVAVTPRARAAGTVTRRESDGRFAFVEIVVDLDVTLEPTPVDESLRGLLDKAQRDCFVGASLAIAPHYRWTVNGKEVG